MTQVAEPGRTIQLANNSKKNQGISISSFEENLRLDNVFQKLPQRNKLQNSIIDKWHDSIINRIDWVINLILCISFKTVILIVRQLITNLSILLTLNYCTCFKYHK